MSKTFKFACLLFSTILTTVSLSAQDIYFPAADEEWAQIDPATVGWNPELLETALDIAGARNSSGVVILHSGRLMAERYWPLDDAPQRYRNSLSGTDALGRAIEDVASAQKSVVALLTGMAQERGFLTIDEPVAKYLGTQWSKTTPSQEQSITIRHLLTMTSGLADDLSFEEDAGTVWRYNTPAYHLLMRVVAAATGKERNELTAVWLTSKLGMENSSWTEREWASADIATGFSTTARELARFGLMIQAGGKWGDEMILADTEYLADMLSPSQELNPSYGYLWWLNGQAFSRTAGANARRVDGQLIASAPPDLVAMQGAMDRKLYLVPSLQLIVTRLGAEGALEGESFNDAFWEALMAAAPAPK